MNNFVRTKGCRGPRGDYYDWCELENDGTLTFGDEQGNYEGGETLAIYWFQGNTIEDYVSAVKKELNYWEKENNQFYNDIINMMKKNNVTLDGILNSGIEIHNKFR